MRRATRMVLMLCAGAAGTALAVLVGVAVAKSFTLQVAKNVKVTNFFSPNAHQTKFESIAVKGGFAVYHLSGDSKSHPKCKTATCFGIWPPATVTSTKKLSKASGITGKLGIWKRDGFMQLTLAGHPLYLFSGDGNHKRIATGEAIHSFHGTWHVIALGGGSSGSPTPTGTTPYTTPTATTTTPTTTTTTPTYPYPYP